MDTSFLGYMKPTSTGIPQSAASYYPTDKKKQTKKKDKKKGKNEKYTADTNNSN